MTEEEKHIYRQQLQRLGMIIQKIIEEDKKNKEIVTDETDDSDDSSYDSDIDDELS